MELEYRTLSQNRRPGAVPHFQNENVDPHFQNENVDCPHFQNEMWAVRVLKCGIGERPRVLSEECGDPPAYERQAAAAHLLPVPRVRLKAAPNVSI